MINFLNDYSEGCAKEILDVLVNTNDIHTVGYGEDEYTKLAIKTIKKEINNENVDIHFLVGGTQTNLTVMSLLKPYEAVISCDSGHINVFECGAIENTGHKIITIPNQDGKINPDYLIKIINDHKSFHMLKPKMLYISNSTEYGTIYNKSELEKLRQICDLYNLYLFIDGARLGSALMAKSNDVTLADITKYSDIYYIGGTKNGLLFGEALIIVNDNLKEDFKFLMKQRGAVLAKGRLLGLQFLELFKNNLFYKLANKANEMADKLRNVFNKYNINYYIKTDTNQLFMLIDKKLYQHIKDDVLCTLDSEYDNYYIIRFVTSFSTSENEINDFDKLLSKYIKS